MQNNDFAKLLQTALLKPAVESEPTVSNEGAGTGALIGLTGGFGGAYLGHKHEEKKKELADLKEKIEEKKKHISGLESEKASLESEAAQASSEGVGGALKGAILGHIGGPITGGIYGHKIKKLDEEIAKHKTELHDLESKHKTSNEALEAMEASLEGVGKGAAIGAIGGFIGTGYLGHKLEERQKELEKLDEKIAEAKREIASMESQFDALVGESLEGFKGAAKGAAVGAAAGIGGSLMGGPIGGLAMQTGTGAAYGGKIKELDEKIKEKKAKLHELEIEVRIKRHAHKKASTESEGGVPVDAPASATEPAEPEGVPTEPVKEVEPATADTVASSEGVSIGLEALSARTRAIIKQCTMGADNANMYLGHKAQSLAKKIEKVEDQLAELKEARAAAKNAKVSNESVELDPNEFPGEASLEGWSGAWAGYKGGAKAFWTKDGKLSFPSMKRYHDWMEAMQVEIDEKADKLKKLKAELKAQLAEDAKAKASNESESTEPTAPAAEPVAAAPAPAAEPAAAAPVTAAEPASTATVVVEETVAPEELEHHLLDAEASLQAAIGAASEMDEVQTVANGLEAILNDIVAQPNGLTPSDARWVNVAIESFTGKYDAPRLVPSIESFGGTTSRREATASLEANVGEVLKQAWEFIKAAAKKFWEHAVAFVGQLFNAGKALVGRATKLKAVAGKLQGEPKAANIKIGSLAAAISVDGNVPANLAEVFGAVEEALKGVEAEAGQQAAKGGALAARVVELSGATDETFANAYKAANDAFVEATKLVPPLFKIKAGDELRSRTFPGEIYFTYKQNDGKPSYGVGHAKGRPTTDEHKTLSPSEIGAVADMAIKAGNELVAFQSDTGEMKKAIKAISVEAIKDNTQLSPENAKQAQALAKKFLAYNNGGLSFALRACSVVVKAGRAAVIIGEKSAAQYAGAPAAAPAAEPAAA